MTARLRPPVSINTAGLLSSCTFQILPMVIVSDARDVDPPSLNQNRLAGPDTAASPKPAKANVMPVIPFNPSSQQSTINQLRQPKLRLCPPAQIDFTSSTCIQ
jgi:hypothetical protein